MKNENKGQRERKMRKTMVLLMVGVFVFGMTASAIALPFDSSGWVDPSYGDSWNADTATGTARYVFYWDN